MDHALRGADDEHFVAAYVHAVDSVFALDARDGLLLAQVPVFDGLVPGSGDEHWGVVEHEGVDAADGLVVRCDLLGLGCAGSEVEHACCFVCAAAEYFLTVLNHGLVSNNFTCGCG